MLFNLVFSRFYAVFYDLRRLGNFYSLSVDKIVLTLFGRFMHFMHVYFIAILISALYKYLLIIIIIIIIIVKDHRYKYE